MTIVALDSSVVVASLLRWHEHNALAILSIETETRTNGTRMLLPSPALLESYSVLTRLPAPYRLRPQDAYALLRETFLGRASLVSLNGEETWSLLEEQAPEQTAGGQIYDAHIVACARRGGARKLLTFNARHFERWRTPQFEIVIPG